MNNFFQSIKYNRIYALIFVLYFVVDLVCVSIANSAQADLKSTQTIDAESLIGQPGSDFFQKGDFANAVLYWSKKVEDFAKGGDSEKHISAMLKLADAYQALGKFSASIQLLNEALNIDSVSQQYRIAIMNSLGSAYTSAGEYQKANEILVKNVDLAREINTNSLLAATLNNFANLLTLKGKFNQAQQAYLESARLADVSGYPQLAAKAAVNSVIASSKTASIDVVEAKILLAQKYLEVMNENHDVAFSWISLGEITKQLAKKHPDKSRWQSYAYHFFKRAIALGEKVSDQRAVSYANGYLGELYLMQDRYDEAMQLTRNAIFAIEKNQAAEILFKWQWQTARILKAKGEFEAAISAYQQSVSTLNSVRQDLLNRQQGESAFAEEISPLYLELADLLLQSTDNLQDGREYQQKLVAAQNTMEQLKAAELQDYFNDDCVSALQQKMQALDAIDQKTAVIYPILLDDRTEILLSLPNGLKRFTIPVTRDVMTTEVREFRQKLENRTTREYLPHAQQLFQWLFEPLQKTFTEQKIVTLVMVPDKSLRTIPMAALHDGTTFLIENYAIVNSPGLSLTDPKPLAEESVHVLAIGLSEAVQGFPALPHVKSELANINKIFGGQVLQDKQFLVNRVQDELKQTPYNIVHIASHGQFKSDAQETFVLSYDNKLNMNKLEQLVGLSRFRDSPLELLTLSACQTAAGDDRAALGLAGIAIKAGARSALATLWFINDQAASKLVTEFYRQLKGASASKAQALRNAQIHIFNNTNYQHPYFWSPFLLIGNWL